MMVRKTLMLAALAAAALPAGAFAQAKCEIDDGKPNQVKDARNALVTAGLVAKPEEKKKQLMKAVSLLTSPQANSNQVGRNWLKSQQDINTVLVDLLFQLVDLFVVGDCVCANIIVPIEQALHGPFQAALGQASHHEDIVA